MYYDSNIIKFKILHAQVYYFSTSSKPFNYLLIVVYLFPIENFSVANHSNKWKFVQFHWLHSVKAVNNRETMKSKTDILKK